MIIKRNLFLNILEPVYKSSTSVNFSSVSLPEVIQLSFSSQGKLLVYGFSSAIQALGIIPVICTIDRTILLKAQPLVNFLKKSKRNDVEISIEDKNSISFRAEGILLLPIYQDSNETFNSKPIEEMQNLDLIKISNNFLSALKACSKYPEHSEILKGLSGIGIYKGYALGVQKERGIIIKLEQEETLPYVLPTHIASSFPKTTEELYGSINNAITITTEVEEAQLIIRFAPLVYQFIEKYGKFFLSYINMDLGKLIFDRKAFKELLGRFSLVDREAKINFKFEEDTVLLYSEENTSQYKEQIVYDKEGLKEVKNFSIYKKFLEELFAFGTGNKFTINLHPDFRFDVPIMVKDKDDWLYSVILQGA